MLIKYLTCKQESLSASWQKFLKPTEAQCGKNIIITTLKIEMEGRGGEESAEEMESFLNSNVSLPEIAKECFPCVKLCILCEMWQNIFHKMMKSPREIWPRPHTVFRCLLLLCECDPWLQEDDLRFLRSGILSCTSEQFFSLSVQLISSCLWTSHHVC